jgi:hypothetical protein
MGKALVPMQDNETLCGSHYLVRPLVLGVRCMTGTDTTRRILHINTSLTASVRVHDIRIYLTHIIPWYPSGQLHYQTIDSHVYRLCPVLPSPDSGNDQDPKTPTSTPSWTFANGAVPEFRPGILIIVVVSALTYVLIGKRFANLGTEIALTILWEKLRCAKVIIRRGQWTLELPYLILNPVLRAISRRNVISVNYSPLTLSTHI